MMLTDRKIETVPKITVELVLDDGSKAALVYENVLDPQICNECKFGVAKTTLTFKPMKYSIVLFDEETDGSSMESVKITPLPEGLDIKNISFERGEKYD